MQKTQTAIDVDAHARLRDLTLMLSIQRERRITLSEVIMALVKLGEKNIGVLCQTDNLTEITK